MVKGKVTIDGFTEEAIKREDVLAVSRKVRGQLEPSMSRHGVGPSRVTIVMKDGTEYTGEEEHCLGSVERPMTADDIARKFRECAPYSVKPIPDDTTEKVIENVRQLDQLDDATEIIRLLG